MSEATTVQYRVLGPMTVEDGGGHQPLGGPKQRLVLALLLLEPDRIVQVDSIIDGVWGDEPPAGAAHNVQSYASELRRILPDGLTFESGGYRLRVDPTRIDARRFGVLVEAGRRDLEGSPDTAAETLREALALWRGEPFADLRYEDALQTEIARLDAMRVTALELRIEADLALGLHGPLADELEALTREHPFHERFWWQLMLASYRSGRRAEALRAFDRARRVLADELGVDPSTDLVELRGRIDASDPALVPASLARRPDRPSPPSVRGFEIRELLGAGRMGRVFAAYQASLGRQVAVKILPAEIASKPSFVREFDRVARRVARLQHPNIVPLLDAWRDPGNAYLVMPLLSGGDLEASLAAGAWEVPAALRVVDQVGAALAHAHRAGIVHGDLDASDVLLDAEGNAFVSDLGLQAVIGRSRRRRSKGPAGGTSEPVIAPDLAGLGILTYRLLTGLPGRQGLDVSDISGLRPEVPDGVGKLLRRATSQDDADTLASVEEYLRTLRRSFGADTGGPAIEDEDAPVRDPYKGLRAFDEGDAEDFFGRDAAIDLAVGRLREQRLVAVVGSSGGGKSSLVRAGLLPKLHDGALPGSDGWLVATMVPGAYPFEELERALREVAVDADEGVRVELEGSREGLRRVVSRLMPPDSELLLVVDQLEELHSMVDDSETRSRFLASLVTATRGPDARIRVVVTARADYFDRFLDDQVFGSAMRDGLVLLSTPSAEELTLAITAPAQRAGLRVEPGLAERIVADVSGRPGALPLMQHALTELVRSRDGRTLTLEAYHVAGGALGALGNRAEQVYWSIEEAARQTVRDVFMRLVALDEGEAPVRRRVAVAELLDLGLDRRLVDEVMSAFGAFRLLTFDRDPVSRGPTVEVAHEALFSQWGRLAGWIEARREDLVLQRRLAFATAEWDAAGRDPGYALTAGRLAEFDHWSARTDLPLSTEEKAYLETSRAREQAADASATRRRRIAVGALALTAIVALVFGAIGFAASETADRERAVSMVRLLLAQSEDAGEHDPDLAILLAVEAVERAEDLDPALLDEATGRLHASIVASRLASTLPGEGEAAWSPDSSRLAFITDFGVREDPAGIQVADRAGGEVGPYLPAPGRTTAIDLAWSPNGRDIVATYIPWDMTASVPDAPPDPDPTLPVIWDVETGARVATLPGTDGERIDGPTFSPDGDLLAARGWDGGLYVWKQVPSSLAGADAPPSRDSETWVRRYQLELDTPSLPDFDPTGERIAIGSIAETDAGEQQVVRIVDAATSATLAMLEAPEFPGGIVDVTWSPEGSAVAALGWAGSAAVLSVDGDDDPIILELDGQQREIEWSPAGDRLAIAGNSGELTMFDTRSWEEVAPLNGHADTITGLAWSPDGRWLASVGADGPVRVWQPGSSGQEVATFESDGVPMARIGWTTDEGHVMGHGLDGTVRVWSSAGGAPTATLPGQQTVGPFGIPMSPDGVHAAITGGPDWSTTLVEADTLDTVWRVPAGGVPSSFSSDGRYLGAGHYGVARILDAATGETVAEYTPDESEPSYFFFTVGLLAGDRWVLLIDPVSAPKLWDWRSGETLDLDYRSGDLAAVVSADGTRFAIGGTEGQMPGARVWDASDLLAGEADAPTVIQPDLPIVPEAFVLGFTPDGEQLFSGFFDNQVTFWDLDSGEAIRIVPHDGPTSGAQVSADEERLLVGGLPPRVYTLDMSELLSVADKRATRELSDEECREYLLLDHCPDPSDRA